MHIISNERALAHWRALCGLPDGMMNRLCDRFIRDQPHLAATLLALSGGMTKASDGTAMPRPSSDPNWAGAERLTKTAAMLVELFQREAGHPLYQLELADLHELTETNVTLFEQFREAAVSDHPETAPQIFENSAQPNMLGGVFVAMKDDPEIRPERMMLESCLLRMTIEGLHLACGDESTPGADDWDTERILIALSAQGDPMRREALKACDSFRAELTREFVLELERWTNDPQTVNDEDVSLGMHALYLLAKWRETSAWPVFRKLFSLPGNMGYELMGDVITEDGSILLAMAGGKRPDELREMIEDASLDEFCRCACLEALTCLVAWGELPREEHISYLRELLTGKLRGGPDNEYILSNVVSTAMDMEAWELTPEIEAAFACDMVAEDVCDLKDFRDAKKEIRGIQWQEFCELHLPVADVAEATDWLDVAPEPETPPLPKEDDGAIVAESDQPYIAPPKVGRNDPCPCGSGKKYKKCCGA